MDVVHLQNEVRLVFNKARAVLTPHYGDKTWADEVWRLPPINIIQLSFIF